MAEDLTPIHVQLEGLPWSMATTNDLKDQGVSFTGKFIASQDFIMIYEVMYANGGPGWARVADLHSAPANYAQTMLPLGGMPADKDFGPNVAQIADVKCFELRWVFIFYNQSFKTTLSQLERFTPLRLQPLNYIRDFLKQIISGLVSLLSNGYYHGDLCPDNIWLGEDGQVYLAGYSLVTIEKYNGLNFYIGPHYRFRPPEPTLVPDESYHPSTADVYAFGVTVLEILSDEQLMQEPFVPPEGISQSEAQKLYFARNFEKFREPGVLYERLKDKSRLTDELIDLLQQCLSPFESKRPKVGLVAKHEYFLTEDERNLAESGVHADLMLPKAVVESFVEDGIIIKKRVGGGNFGSIYRVRFKNIRRAMKVLAFKDFSPEYTKTTMVLEEKVIRACVHKHIIKNVAVIEDPFGMFYIMELAVSDLDQERKRLGRTTPQTAPIIEFRMLEWMYQTALAVAFMHSKGFAHRDIKPQNVLIRTNGEAALADFGLVIETQEGQTTSEMAGTPQFMPPQALRGEAYEPFKFDVWSFGILTNVMLTGTTKYLYHTFSPNTYEQEWAMFPPRINECPFSHAARELMFWTLVMDEKMRLKMEDVLAHPWFNGGNLPRGDQLGPITPLKSPQAGRRPRTAAFSEHGSM